MLYKLLLNSTISILTYTKTAYNIMQTSILTYTKTEYNIIQTFTE